MAKTYLLLFMVVALVFVPAISAHAEEMVLPSSGKSVYTGVDLQSDSNGQAKVKVSFYDKSSTPGAYKIQPHVDFNVVIADSTGATVYDLSKVTNQPTYHVAEPGSVTLPVKFPQNGSYKVTVTVVGILFNPINPETAEFSVNVTPEFPVGAMVAVAAVMAGVVAVFRIKKF